MRATIFGASGLLGKALNGEPIVSAKDQRGLAFRDAESYS